MDTSVYRHTQPGHLMRVTLLVMMVVSLATLTLVRAHLHGAPVVTITSLFVAGSMLLCLWLFNSMTVTVTDGRLMWSFGPGVIKRDIPLSEIVECKPVVNPWYYGWGIHFTPRGWLYNVSGFGAVEISLRNGSSCRIGTDSPQELAAAILQARNRS